MFGNGKDPRLNPASMTPSITFNDLNDVHHTYKRPKLSNRQAG